MTADPAPISEPLPALPAWVTAEVSGFSAGAALALFDQVLRGPAEGVPQALLRDRLATGAALCCLRLQGRGDSAADLRDAVCLTHAGDALGPGGEMLDLWRRAARVRLDLPGWRPRLAPLLQTSGEAEDALAGYATRLGGSPVTVATAVLAEVLAVSPDLEARAAILADVALARACGWTGMVPLIGAHLTRRDIRAILEDKTTAPQRVHRAVTEGAAAGLQLAAALTRRAAHLHRVAPQLRMKEAEAAVALFLHHDALSPRVLRDRLAVTDRAARRFCDRLVALDAVREVTGRATSRLYGL